MKTARGSSDGSHRLVILFLVYLALLIWVVLWKLEVPHVGEGDLREVKLAPFVASGGAGASSPSEVVANVVLFVPFGLYLGLLAPLRPWWRLAGLVGAASLAMEVTQYVLALGISDATDLIANTAGGVIGLGLIALARRRLRDRARAVMIRACSIGTALVLLFVTFFIASPLRYAPQRALAVEVVAVGEPMERHR